MKKRCDIIYFLLLNVSSSGGATVTVDNGEEITEHQRECTEHVGEIRKGNRFLCVAYRT